MSKKDTEYVKKRKSYYGFSRYYPGRIGAKSYIIGDSVTEKKREISRRILIALLIILLFITSFVVTSVCLDIAAFSLLSIKKSLAPANDFLFYSSSQQQPQSQSLSQSSKSMSSSSFSPLPGHSIVSSSSISSSRRISAPQRGHSTS